jgi:hypothetical protein
LTHSDNVLHTYCDCGRSRGELGCRSLVRNRSPQLDNPIALNSEYFGYAAGAQDGYGIFLVATICVSQFIFSQPDSGCSKFDAESLQVTIAIWILIASLTELSASLPFSGGPAVFARTLIRLLQLHPRHALIAGSPHRCRLWRLVHHAMYCGIQLHADLHCCWRIRSNRCWRCANNRSR